MLRKMEIAWFVFLVLVLLFGWYVSATHLTLQINILPMF